MQIQNHSKNLKTLGSNILDQKSQITNMVSYKACLMETFSFIEHNANQLRKATL